MANKSVVEAVGTRMRVEMMTVISVAIDNEGWPTPGAGIPGRDTNGELTCTLISTSPKAWDWNSPAAPSLRRMDENSLAPWQCHYFSDVRHIGANSAETDWSIEGR